MIFEKSLTKRQLGFTSELSLIIRVHLFIRSIFKSS